MCCCHTFCLSYVALMANAETDDESVLVQLLERENESNNYVYPAIST